MRSRGHLPGLFGGGLVLVLGALSLLSPAAHGARRVEGGGSFTDAPVLKEGTYSDTIRLREELFYGIDLAQGQQLAVEVKAIGKPRGPLSPTATLQLQIFNPLRDADIDFDLVSFTGADTASARVKGKRVGSDKDPDSAYAQPGTYYVSLKFFTLLGKEKASDIAGEEYRTRIKLRVTGAAVSPSPTPTPTPTVATPTPSDSPTEAAAPAPPPPRTGGGSSSEPSFFSVSLVAFLVGAIGSFLLTAGRGLVRSRA